MGAEMDMPFKYLISDKDRRGNERYYVRVPGRKKVRIRETFGTLEFRTAYDEAMEGVDGNVAAAIKPGSFRWLCVKYFSSDQFKRNDESTQDWQKRSLEGVCETHGTKPVALMRSRHVRKIRNEKSDTPAAANLVVKSMRTMFSWANEEE